MNLIWRGPPIGGRLSFGWPSGGLCFGAHRVLVFWRMYGNPPPVSSRTPIRQSKIRLFFMDASSKWASNVEKRAFDVVLQASNRRIGLIALAVVVLDQITKQIVLRHLSGGQERVVIDGFFRFVYLGNTGGGLAVFSAGVTRCWRWLRWSRWWSYS